MSRGVQQSSGDQDVVAVAHVVAEPPAGLLREALGRALAGDPARVARLRFAGTTVRFSVAGDASQCTLLLDRRPPAMCREDGDAEIEVTLQPQAAEHFARGEISLVAALLRGEATARGPVRRYLEVDAILRGLIGGDASGFDPPGSAAAAPKPEILALQTRGLVKRFGEHVVLDGVDLAVPEGVISVILGPSGTGKSVMLKHVIGLLAPDAGDVLVRGRSLGRMSRSEILALRRDVGVMFQDGALFSAMNVYDNVAFPLRQHTDLREDEIAQVVDEHLASVGLSNAAGRRPSELSGGMRKRAGLARAFALEPGIVLCDEPDSGLDPVRTALLGDLLVRQHAIYGGTIVVVTHNVALARRIGEHVSVLWKGRVLESGLMADLLRSDNAFVRQFLAGETDGPLGMDA